MSLNPGELNRQITLQSKTDTIDANGYDKPTWTDVKTVWAAIKTTGSREFYAAQKQIAETTKVFKIRYTAVDSQMRIKYGNGIYEILGINNVNEANIELQISAKEVV
jgi:SPP1 family predicted phage head-tail adaptor